MGLVPGVAVSAAFAIVFSHRRALFFLDVETFVAGSALLGTTGRGGDFGRTSQGVPVESGQGILLNKNKR